MKYSFLFSLLVLCLNLFSQNPIDEKNGFKDFYFGDSYEKHKNYLTYIGIANEGGDVYKYTGSCCKNFVDYAIESI